MIPKDKQAAQMLLGKKLDGGWEVVRKIEKSAANTGGRYSSCYEVRNGERKGFLKAFDLSAADKAGGSAYDQVRDMMNAFKLEKDILETCSIKKCRNVIQLLHHGDTEVEEAKKYPRVDYLILEFAEEGDIRDAIENKFVSIEWKLRSLHQLAKGLSQIHAIEIAHQDIKPSNIVALRNGQTILTDFGSAVYLNQTNTDLPYHLTKDYAGSWEYAPPELLYGYVSENSFIRRIGCDLYLLGSMVVFYVLNISMTALIRNNLEDRFCWTTQSTYKRYDEIKSYLIQAYEKSLEDIGNAISDEKVRTDLVYIVKHLCHPDPLKRGHHRNINEHGSNFGLNRILSIFDRLIRYVIIKNRQNGSNF